MSGLTLAGLLGFTTEAPAAPSGPAVLAISPNVGTEDGGTVVQITVDDSTGATGGSVGGVPLTSFSILDGTHVQGTTGAHAPGNADVVVTNGSGDGTLVDGYQYRYVLSIDPESVWRLDSAVSVIDAVDGVDADSVGAGVTLGVTGHINDAAEFNRTDNDCYVDFGQNYGFERTDAFSVSLWLNAASSEFGHLVSKRDPSTSSPDNRRGWSIRLLSTGECFVALVNDWLIDVISVDSVGQTLNDGTWRHVAFTYDGSSSAGGVKIYVDGSQVGDTDTLDSLTGTILTSNGNFMFGMGGNPGDLVALSPYQGKLDDVAIYSGELTAADLAKIYARGNSGYSAAFGGTV